MKRQTLITSLLLLTIVFALGVIVGNVQTSEDDALTKLLRQSELDSESVLVEQELFDTLGTDCIAFENRLRTLSHELWNLGKVLDTTEQELGTSYNFLKRKYHLLQLRTYTLIKKLQDDCDKQTNVVLFYFSRNDNNSFEQGRILDSLVRTFNITVFAIEYNYSKELSFVEDYYKITTTPSSVVNFEHVLTGLQDEDAIKTYLHE